MKSQPLQHILPRKETNTLNFRFPSGLVIDPSHPLRGATPDSFVECKCYGKGVIEVKCPYSCKQKSIEQRTEDSQFFLKQNEKGDLYLDPYHTYYFQVQAQLKFCSASYADFVVWTEKELFVQRIFHSSVLCYSNPRPSSKLVFSQKCLGNGIQKNQ